MKFSLVEEMNDMDVFSNKGCKSISLSNEVYFPRKDRSIFVYVRILRRSEVLLNIWYSAHFRPNIWYSENWGEIQTASCAATH